MVPWTDVSVPKEVSFHSLIFPIWKTKSGFDKKKTELIYSDNDRTGFDLYVYYSLLNDHPSGEIALVDRERGEGEVTSKVHKIRVQFCLL